MKIFILELLKLNQKENIQAINSKDKSSEYSYFIILWIKIDKNIMKFYSDILTIWKRSKFKKLLKIIEKL
jgi:hypothetical protein